MKYTIYKDPLTHRSALLPLPSRFVEGDKFPIVATDRWFGSRVEYGHEHSMAGAPHVWRRFRRPYRTNGATDSKKAAALSN